VIVAFRDPAPGSAPGALGGVPEIFGGGVSSAPSGNAISLEQQSWSIPVWWPFEYSAAGDTVAYRVPGCGAPATTWLQSLAQSVPALPERCALSVSAVRYSSGRASVSVRCASACLGATAADSYVVARPLDLPAGGSTIVSERVACPGRRGGTAEVQFWVGSVNGPELERSARVPCR
jgi:hypothetical protein